METALQSFLVSVPQAVAIWMIMLLAVALAVALLALPRGSASAPRPARSGRAVPGRAAADRAAVAARRLRADWVLAQTRVDDAWAAYQEADRAARRVAAATAYPVMSRRRRRDENADRERWLHHAALTACRTGQLSIGQLNDVLAHRGWNPRLHPVVQEAALCGAVREHRFAVYRAAAGLEREAWESAERAAEALRVLRAGQLAPQARAEPSLRAGHPVTRPLPTAGSSVDGRHPIAA